MEALNAFHDAVRAKSWPEDDLRPVEDTRRTYGNSKTFKNVTFYGFCLCDGGHIAGQGLEASTNQLEMAALDRNLLRRWQADAPVETFELGFLTGQFPAEEEKQLRPRV